MLLHSGLRVIVEGKHQPIVTKEEFERAQKVLHAVFGDPEGTLKNAVAVLGCGIAGVEQAEVLRDKETIEERLKKEQGRYETFLDMRMNNEIPREVFSRKQQEVEKKIAEPEVWIFI